MGQSGAVCACRAPEQAALRGRAARKRGQAVPLSHGRCLPKRALSVPPVLLSFLFPLTMDFASL